MAEVSSKPTAPSCPRLRGVEFPRMSYRQQKEEAVARLQELNVAGILEELLNKACRFNPDDLFGYMSEYFHSLSKEPVISSVSGFEGLDSSGKRSVEVELYCTVCGVDKLLSKSSLPVEPQTTVPESVITTPMKGSPKRRKGGSPRTSPVTSTIRLPEATPPPALGLVTEKKINLIDTVKLEISKALKGLPVRKQREVDQALEILRVKAAADKVVLEPSALLAVSCAVALAGSQLSSHPLFLYLSPCDVPQSSPSSTTLEVAFKVDTCSDGSGHSINEAGHLGTHKPSSSRGLSLPIPGPSPSKHPQKHGSLPVTSNSKGLSLPVPPPPSKPPQKYSLPLPVAAMLGQSTGKLKVREFCVCPLPISAAPQQVKMLHKLHSELGRILASKLGAGSRATLPNGAYSASLDKLEQGIEFIKEATVSAGFQYNVDAAVVIDMGADMLYDEDKGKYEIMAGHWKSSDELINLYSDLVNHANNGVLGFIDPLHPKDLAGWKKLVDKLSSKCLIMADNTLEKGLSVVKQRKEEEPQLGSGRPSTQEGGSHHVKLEDGKVDAEGEETVGVEGLSCAAMTWKNSLSNTIDRTDHWKGCCLHVMLAAPHNLTVNTVLADLAVATHCKFLRLGAPTGMVNLLLSRLLWIHEELISRNLLETAQNISFSDSQQ